MVAYPVFTAPVFTAPGYKFEAAPDLSHFETRERLSPPAIEGFFAILAQWKIPIETGAALLGGRSRASVYSLKPVLKSTPKTAAQKIPSKTGPRAVRTLSQDELTRISFMVGIFKALHILLPDALADAWMTRPNDNPLFCGQTPLAFMLQQGIPGFREVRNLLDAARGGQ